MFVKTPQNETDTQHIMAKKEQRWHISALEDESLVPTFVQYSELQEKNQPGVAV